MRLWPDYWLQKTGFRRVSSSHFKTHTNIGDREPLGKGLESNGVIPFSWYDRVSRAEVVKAVKEKSVTGIDVESKEIEFARTVGPNDLVVASRVEGCLERSCVLEMQGLAVRVLD